MEQVLLKWLPHCTARIILPGQNRAGSGCFVAPGTLLTCAHVVTAALTGTAFSSVEVCWEGNRYSAQVHKVCPECDLALLHVPVNEHHCVLLSNEVYEIQPHEHLCSYGYPDDHPQGDTVTSEFEGLTQEAFPLLKLKLGQIRPGMSGAPLLDERTGTVCGIIELSRGRESDLGGRAIPISTIIKVFPELIEGQRQYQRSDQGWTMWLTLPLTPHVDRNRQRMLDRVRRHWVKGVLEPSLHAAPLISLNLQEYPSLVESPLRAEANKFGPCNRSLRAGTRIQEVRKNHAAIGPNG